MQILCHGGKCCGIKHIYGFEGSPLMPQPSLDTKYEDVLGGYGQSTSAGKSFFRGNAPKESSIERLDRFLAFIKKHQPRGLIEVTLVDDEEIYQKTYWEETLLERGFELVLKFKNSNTENTIYLYHKINK